MVGILIEPAEKKLYDNVAEGKTETIINLLQKDPFLLKKKFHLQTLRDMIHSLGLVDGGNGVTSFCISAKEKPLKKKVKQGRFPCNHVDCPHFRRNSKLPFTEHWKRSHGVKSNSRSDFCKHCGNYKFDPHPCRFMDPCPWKIIQYLTKDTKIDKKSKNSKWETPITILKQRISYFGSDHDTDEIKRLLRSGSTHSSQTPPVEWLTRKRDSIMVVVMAFQAAVSPTGGVWQEDTLAHKAGEAYKDPHIYRNFIRSNTVAFVSSLSIILLLIIGLPFRYRFFMIMWVSVTITYGASIMVATPKESLSRIIQLAIVAWVGLMTILLLANTTLSEIEECRN
ncbi:hypothetical protein SASPL_129298 [Salvia splendens]|uniref:PGG domain-containing protein n=1 Tax=Salvia splendens TaxID=180675 RepID=A0A8X8XCV5_SALSN|nr:hypothetical protein SASPL_129298 [Salvia splendens]